MKLIRKIAGSSSHRTVFLALGNRNFSAPSEEYLKRNRANEGIEYDAVCSIASPQRVNLGKSRLHSRILEMMRRNRMQDAFFLHNDLHSSSGNPEKLNYAHPLYVHPSFCLRLFIVPSCLGSLIESEPDVAAEDDPGVLRADSVKKKRKRKMNKHKLRKLRRLLRRKTH